MPIRMRGWVLKAQSAAATAEQIESVEDFEQRTGEFLEQTTMQFMCSETFGTPEVGRDVAAPASEEKAYLRSKGGVFKSTPVCSQHRQQQP